MEMIEIPSKSYSMGKYPVTVEQWNKYATIKELPLKSGDKRAPVTEVSYYDVLKYIEWLNETTGCAYRLPDEAEWGHACRAGTTTLYSFGDDESELEHYAWYSKNCVHKMPVGLKKPNPWGLYDMHGNIWEMTRSVYKNEITDDVTSLKGGMWRLYARLLRSASQLRFYRCIGSINVGFRLIKENSDIKTIVKGGGADNYPRNLRSATRSRSSRACRIPALGFRLIKENKGCA